MKPRKADDDRERRNSFMAAALAVWVLIFGFLLLRDPLWRLLHEGEFVSSASGESGWPQLDSGLVRELGAIRPLEVSGLSDFEEMLFDGLTTFRQAEGTEDAPLAPPVRSDALSRIARHRAQRRADLDPDQPIEDPDFLFPALYLALTSPNRLVNSVDLYQELPSGSPTKSPDYAVELIGGWMNRLRFQNLVAQAQDLEIGIGAVQQDSGEVMVEVLLRETVATVNQRLPTVVSSGESLAISGQDFLDNPVELLFKGPADPSFRQLKLERSGLNFKGELSWDQGKGNYLLRANRGQRLSDPRPFIVE